jgi:hypothetical protein
MTSYRIPAPDSQFASQFFVLFRTEYGDRVGVNVPKILEANSKTGSLLETPGNDYRDLFEGGLSSFAKKKASPVVAPGYNAIEIPGAQLVKEVTGHFESKTVEHPIQGDVNQTSSFSLDHVFSTLKSFSVSATLYQGRYERLKKLEELRDSHTLLTIICDFGLFQNYVITLVEPVLSMDSANAFEVNVTFQEVRKVTLTEPLIETFEETYSNETVHGGVCTLERTEQGIPENRSWWQNAIEYFTDTIRDVVTEKALGPFGSLVSVPVARTLIDKVHEMIWD